MSTTATPLPTPPPAANVVSLADARLDTGRRDEDESTIGGTQTCIVCMVGSKSHLAFPCGHQCACESCANQMADCPVCRTSNVKWIKVHVA